MPKKPTYEELEQRIKKLEKESIKRKEVEEDLKLHGEIVENMAEGVYLIRTNGAIIVYANKTFEDMFGYDHGELIGKHVSIVNAPMEKTPEETADEIITSLKGKGTWSGEVYNIKKNGTPFWCHANVSAFNHPDFGEIWISVHEDITDRRQAEEALREKKEFSDSLIASMQDGLSILDSHGVHIDVNIALCQMTGFSREELIGVGPPHPYWPPEAYEEIETAFQETLRGEFSSFELLFMRKNGERFPVIISPSWIKDEQGNVISYFAMFKDITERKRAEEQIQVSLREKEVLLKEIHHRVKNNLQVISSLLDLSSMRIQDKKAISMFTDARSKIQTMALIHSQIYLSERFDKIDMESHIRELVSYLSSVYAERKRITSVIEISYVYLPITQAIPCALILNELISNAFKHAFKEDHEGIIEISVQKSDQDTIYARIKDNGTSIPEEIDIYKTNTLGLKLVRNVVQKQLNGKIQVKRNKGTEFIIEFKILKEELDHV